MVSHYVFIGVMLWLAWMLSWVAAASWRYEPSTAAPAWTYRWLLLVATGGIVMLFPLSADRSRMLWEVGPLLGWTSIALMVLAFSFAWWARIALGKLWSGAIELTEQHRVVAEGPYALVRHPIYTALILGAIGLALVRATPMALLGTVLIALALAFKARVEERFLEDQIGGYEAYRRKVPMLVPGWPMRG